MGVLVGEAEGGRVVIRGRGIGVADRFKLQIGLQAWAEGLAGQLETRAAAQAEGLPVRGRGAGTRADLVGLLTPDLCDPVRRVRGSPRSIDQLSDPLPRNPVSPSADTIPAATEP